MDISTIKVEALIAMQGITKSELAKRSNMSRQNISTIIRRGTCEPRTAGKLAAGLGEDVLEILADKEKEG